MDTAFFLHNNAPWRAQSTGPTHRVPPPRTRFDALRCLPNETDAGIFVLECPIFSGTPVSLEHDPMVARGGVHEESARTLCPLPAWL